MSLLANLVFLVKVNNFIISKTLQETLFTNNLPGKIGSRKRVEWKKVHRVTSYAIMLDWRFIVACVSPICPVQIQICALYPQLLLMGVASTMKCLYIMLNWTSKGFSSQTYSQTKFGLKYSAHLVNIRSHNSYSLRPIELYARISRLI